MADRIPQDKKKKPSFNFIIFIPLKFSVSAPTGMQSKFKEKVKNSERNMSFMFKKWFFELFGVRNAIELLTKNKDINRRAIRLKEEIKDEMGLNNNEFSKYYREKIDGYIKK